MVKVEVVYVTKTQDIIERTCSLPENASVFEALEASKIFQTHPETRQLCFGIFSKRVAGNHPIKSGDRIEIYRPLTLDPKEKRRQRAVS